MTFIFSKMEEAKTSMGTLLMAALQTDWWFFSAQSQVTTKMTEEAKCHPLFLMGVQTSMMMAYTALVS